jgi:hypothetical protein
VPARDEVKQPFAVVCLRARFWQKEQRSEFPGRSRESGGGIVVLFHRGRIPSRHSALIIGVRRVWERIHEMDRKGPISLGKSGKDIGFEPAVFYTKVETFRYHDI